MACKVVIGQQEIQLVLNGDLTIAEVASVHHDAIRAIAAGIPITVDLSGVTYLDAAMLQLLAAMRTAAAGLHIGLTLKHASETLHEDAQLLGLSKVLLGDPGVG